MRWRRPSFCTSIRLRAFGCRVFVADYHGGDRTVIAPPPQFRAQIASLGCAALLRRGALAVQMTYQTDVSESEDPFCSH